MAGRRGSAVVLGTEHWTSPLNVLGFAWGHSVRNRTKQRRKNPASSPTKGGVLLPHPIQQPQIYGKAHGAVRTEAYRRDKNPLAAGQRQTGVGADCIVTDITTVGNVWNRSSLRVSKYENARRLYPSNRLYSSFTFLKHSHDLDSSPRRSNTRMMPRP